MKNNFRIGKKAAEQWIHKLYTKRHFLLIEDMEVATS